MHVRPKGTFDGNSAWELINLIHEKYNGLGRVFIDTRGLGEIHPFGRCIFKDHLDSKILPFRRLFFKGEKGLEIAPNGSRILIATSQKTIANSRKTVEGTFVSVL